MIFDAIIFCEYRSFNVFLKSFVSYSTAPYRGNARHIAFPEKSAR